MRNFLYTFIFLLTSAALFAQPYGNEWIDYNQTYYKFQSDHDGLVRITYETLVSTGIDLDGNGLRIVSNGLEIPIYINDQENFGAGDYIEFYGSKNDGSFDASLYESPEMQTHPALSLFSDMRTYFIYSDDSGTPLRFKDLAFEVDGSEEAEAYFIHKSKQHFNDAYHFGKPYSASGVYNYYSDFDEGEGWTSQIIKDYSDIPPIGFNSGFDVNIPTPGLFEEATEMARFKCKLIGRDQSLGVYNNQNFEINLDGQMLLEGSFANFSTENYEIILPLSSIETDSNINDIPHTILNFLALNGTTNGFPYESAFSIGNSEIEYPRAFDFGGSNQFQFNYEVDGDKYFEIENFDGGTEAVIYDLSALKRIVPTEENGIYQFKAEQIDLISSRSFYISNPETTIEITDIAEKNFIDFSSIDLQGNYLIISHPNLTVGPEDQVARYADYRQSIQGGEFSSQVVFIDDLYDSFSYGIEKHPLAIQNFVNFAIDNWATVPEYLNLMGKGIRYDLTRYDSIAYNSCLVPSYGFVASDNLLAGRDFGDYRPQLAVGRIPAQNPLQLKAYLDKVVEHESLQQNYNCEDLENISWMKNTVQIAKGWGQNETSTFLSYLDQLENHISDSAGYNIVNTFLDSYGPASSGDLTPYEDNPEFETNINEGLAIINYTGYSLPSCVWQFDIQEAESYDNAGKYPFIYANTSFTGNINGEPQITCMAEDFLMTPGKGAIGFMAPTDYSYAGYVQIISEAFFKNLAGEFYGQSVGKNIQNTFASIYQEDDDLLKAISNEMTFAGDPAIKIHYFKQKDIDLIEVISNADTLNNLADSIYLDLVIVNNGAPLDSAVNVQINRRINQTAEYLFKEIEIFPKGHKDTMQLKFKLDFWEDGENEFICIIDPENELSEICEENNESSVKISFQTCQTDCVWPGDTNKDGIADNWDLLNIGWGFDQSGFVRKNGNILWVPQTANNWGNDFNDGNNYKHADCNGDSEINKSDIDVIKLNYGNTADKNSEDVETDIDLDIVPNQTTIQLGDTLSFDFVLGNENNLVDVYGIAFSVEYNPIFIDEESVNIRFTDSFLGDTISNISLVKQHLGKVDIGYSKTDQLSVIGSGSFGSLVVIIDNLDGKTDLEGLEFKVTAGVVMDGAQELNYIIEKSVNINYVQTALDEISGETNLESFLKIYPNPASDYLVFESNEMIDNISIYDLQGKEVLNRNASSINYRLNLHELKSGLYLVGIEKNNQIYFRKIIIN